MNTTESRGLSLARGFTVLIMPAVHSVLLYSTATVKEGHLGQVLGFLAEGPGAELFMFLMGVFIALGRPKSARQIFMRSIIIMIAGYLLNLARFTIPYYLGIIPVAYLKDNGISIGPSTASHLLLVGDILQFASIAYFICAISNHYKVHLSVNIFVVLLILYISPYTWQISFGNQLAHRLTGLLNATPPIAFFPVFPWLCYPLAGLIIAQVYIQFTYTRIIRIHFLAGISLILFGYLLEQTEPMEWRSSFYRPGRGGTLWHTGVVIFWIAMFIMLSKAIKNSKAFSILQYLSKHITVIYITQWIIILWMFPIFGYNNLRFAETLGAIIITSLLSFLLPVMLARVRRRL